MVNAISILTPQPVAVEGPIDAGKQAGTADSSFTDVLNAAVAGEETSGKEAPKGDAKADVEVKADGEMIAASEIAGAVQVAMVVPVQANVQLVMEAVPEAVDSAVVAEVSSEVAQPVQSQAQQVSEAPHVSQAQAGAAVDLTQFTAGVKGELVASVPTPVGTDPKAEQIVATQSAPQAPVQAGTLIEGQPVPNDQPVAEGLVSGLVQEPIRTDVSQEANPAAVRSEVPVANVAAQPVVSDEQKTASAESVLRQAQNAQVAKVEKPSAAVARETNPVAVSQASVETVPVQWKFDGAMQGPRIFTTEVAAQMLVQPLGESNTKATGGESGSASGQGSTDPQAAASMGLQFNAALREAGVQTAAATSEPDLHVRVIDQVVREVRLSQINGQSNLVVKLNPPDLGSMRLQISQDATGMVTHIQASSSQVRGLLEANMPLLMDSLSKAGLQMDSVSVSVGTSFNAFAQNAHHGAAQQNTNQARQQFASGRQMGGIQTAADFAPAWGGSGQAGYSWLA